LAAPQSAIILLKYLCFHFSGQHLLIDTLKLSWSIAGRFAIQLLGLFRILDVLLGICQSSQVVYQAGGSRLQPLAELSESMESPSYAAAAGANATGASGARSNQQAQVISMD
jgi:hypothetical protein